MPISKKAKVAVIGEFFVDEIFTGFNVLPNLGEESFARKFHREVGGGAAITACGLAKLGVQVLAIGSVGKEDGAWLIDRLISLGVNCSGLHLHRGSATGITVSVSTREDRAFFTYYGANKHLRGLLRKPETAETLASCNHIHFACAPDADTDRRLIGSLRDRAKISIDVQSHMTWLTRPESLKILRLCDIFFPNEQEAGWLSSAVEPRDILHRLRDEGLSGVGLKLGGKGAALLWRRRTFRADPFPVTTVETTGAGDCFNAGFIFGRLRGYSPQRCLTIANICGALSTRALGGIAGFPSLKELMDSESHLLTKT
ncbi:MAG: carbohydrate kinase family protein [Bryobacteraceae bacterium]